VRLDVPQRRVAGASPPHSAASPAPAAERPVHLTYCTNIHPGDGWSAVAANIRRYAPALKAQLSPAGPFGLGLRLSARDARELLDGRALDDFREWLDAEGLYVALINGFPYGPFHGTPVKADVYAPDWRDEARVTYTLDLIRILRRLLPPGLDGGVSTAPLTYKAWMPRAGPSAWPVMTRNVARVTAALVEARSSGAMIHLDIEPEPDCLLETSGETIDFFEQWLLPVGGEALRQEQGLTLDEAQGALLDHVRVCFDCCHFAVEYEDPAAALDRFHNAGIGIGRVQLSSALDVPLPASAAGRSLIAGRLRPFADATYLHQVIARRAGALHHFSDLDVALDTAAGSDDQWRIHFHVPLFASDYEGLGSTQNYVRQVIGAAVADPFTTHLEIETYTWDVLPGALKLDLGESIRREYEWVLGAVRDARSSPATRG
jgi:sugar phosphate isomerase/epimerase